MQPGTVRSAAQELERRFLFGGLIAFSRFFLRTVVLKSPAHGCSEDGALALPAAVLTADAVTEINGAGGGGERFAHRCV